MLQKLIVLILFVLLFFSCKKDNNEKVLVNLALDYNFGFNTRTCEFNVSERHTIDFNFENNSCLEQAEHKVNVIIGEQIKKRIYLQRGHSFMNGVNTTWLKQYLGKGFFKVTELNSSYLYSNRNMFQGVEIIEKEKLFMDWDIQHACLIEITDTYYSADKNKAVLGLLNYCGHSEIYLIYYFINIKGTWLINFVEVGD